MAVDDSAALAVLVDNHRAFLQYLERRVGDRALAEDLLQDAFVRTADRAESVPDEALVPWFYRVLRNAVIDHYRRSATAARSLAVLAREVEPSEPPPDIAAEICACIGRLAGTLTPDYAAALRTVDVEGVPVKTYAEASGLTASNAGVRLHRARQALRRKVQESCGTCADHGCRDCSCGRPRRSADQV